jgi:hypothetical protein
MNAQTKTVLIADDDQAVVRVRAFRLKQSGAATAPG